MELQMVMFASLLQMEMYPYNPGHQTSSFLGLVALTTIHKAGGTGSHFSFRQVQCGLHTDCREISNVKMQKSSHTLNIIQEV